MKPRFVAATVLAACLLLPAAASAANVVDASFGTGFTTMKMKVQIDITGDDAKGFRAGADKDHDNVATQAEIDAFMAGIKELVGGQATNSLGDNITLDGKGPTAGTVDDVSAPNAAGATSSGATFSLHMTATLTFVPGAGPKHTFMAKGSASEGSQTAQITVHAPSGFVIESQSGLPSVTVASDKESLSFTDSSGNGQTGTITFAPQSSSSSPGAGLLALLCVLGLAVVVRRKA